MKNIKGYIEHLRESNSTGTPEELGRRLRRIIDDINHPDIEEVKRLIQAGADVNVENEGSGTPLERAVAHGHTDIARMLIDAGAIVDWEGDYLLHAAASKGNTGMAELLIGAGADIEEEDEHKWRPLHYAAYNGSKGIVRLLIGAGAELEARDERGDTALNLAVTEYYREMARLLIEEGADILAAFKTLDDLEQFFNGNIDWIPGDNPGIAKFKKQMRARGAFGRF